MRVKLVAAILVLLAVDLLASPVHAVHAFNEFGGGAIRNDGATVTVSNSTFSDNETNRPDNTLTLENSIVANSSTGSNCLGPIAGAANLSYPDATCPGMNADPMLGPLQDNGGPTFTMEPDLASPAIDAGNDTTCQTDPVSGHDQRGVMRPVGSHCDIGAVEVNYLPFRKWFALARVR